MPSAFSSWGAAIINQDSLNNNYDERK